MPEAHQRLIRAGAVCDARGPVWRPGAVVVLHDILGGTHVKDWGDPDELTRRYGSDLPVTDLPDRLLTPGGVNAHVHLDLHGVGPVAYPGDFVAWGSAVRDRWAERTVEAVAAGAASAALSGVEAVGDIVTHVDAQEARQGAGLRGVSYFELLGLGSPFDGTDLERVRATQKPGLGWQPHAPYSTGRRLFVAAAESGAMCATHLAEMPEEVEFVARGTGPFRALLERIGKWHDAFAEPYRGGLSPVRWMQAIWEGRAANWLVAHCNYIGDDDIALLAEHGVSVAYCPLASTYFGHRGHRYRDLLAAGVNVCLGSDSILCQPPGEPQPYGLLPVMRDLYRRDGVNPHTLLGMATHNGLRALRLDPDIHRRLMSLRFDPSDPSDPLVQVLSRDDPAGVVELSFGHE